MSKAMDEAFDIIRNTDNKNYEKSIIKLKKLEGKVDDFEKESFPQLYEAIRLLRPV